MANNVPKDLDYRALGLVCGIEIHQQLDTASKLFCGCPTKHREVDESNFEFFRYLRPSRSELGEIDRAALEEVLVSRKFLYNPTTQPAWSRLTRSLRERSTLRPWRSLWSSPVCWP